MKKNKMMRIGSGVLVLALITTCAFSGAMAKYVISDYDTDSARVAKFGVVLGATGDLFGQSYNAGYTANTAGVVQAWSEHNPTVAVNSTDQGNGVNVIAPGTRNDKGMTFYVKGTPEVSTVVTVDQPEGDAANGLAEDADLVNTDVYLKAGKYSVMVKVVPGTVEVTTDNMTDFYKLSEKKFTPLASADLTNLGTTITEIYRKVDLTNATATMNGTDYYPIQWTVKNTAGTAVIDSAQGAALMGTGNGSILKAVHDELTIDDNTPNTPIDQKVNVSWKWDYGTAWADGASDTLLPNWENTTLIDLEDTTLGMLIAAGASASGTTGVGSITDYFIAVDNGTAIDQVQYKLIDAGSGSANKVIVAFTGTTDPTTWDGANVACLNATFGARITVAQAD